MIFFDGIVRCVVAYLQIGIFDWRQIFSHLICFPRMKNWFPYKIHEYCLYDNLLCMIMVRVGALSTWKLKRSSENVFFRCIFRRDRKSMHTSKKEGMGNHDHWEEEGLLHKKVRLLLLLPLHFFTAEWIHIHPIMFDGGGSS